MWMLNRPPAKIEVLRRPAPMQSSHCRPTCTGLPPAKHTSKCASRADREAQQCKWLACKSSQRTHRMPPASHPITVTGVELVKFDLQILADVKSTVSCSRAHLIMGRQESSPGQEQKHWWYPARLRTTNKHRPTRRIVTHQHEQPRRTVVLCAPKFPPWPNGVAHELRLGRRLRCPRHQFRGLVWVVAAGRQSTSAVLFLFPSQVCRCSPGSRSSHLK